MSLANGGVDIQLVEGRKRNLVYQVELLRQRQADGARQRQPVFFERVLVHDQLLLQSLIINPGAQLIEQRRGPCLVHVDRLVERNLGRRHLGSCSGDKGFIGQHQEIGVAHRQHHHLACIFSRQLRGVEVVARRQVISDRVHIHHRPREARAQIGVAKGPHDAGKSWDPQSQGSQVHLLQGPLPRSIHRGQKRLHLAQALASDSGRLGGAQNGAQVVQEAALNGLVQRQVQRLRRYLAGRHAALITG